MKLLGIDTESTGLHEDANLLTLYMSVIDENFLVLESLDLALKPESEIGRSVYSVQPEAMEVNKINLAEHDQVAVTYKSAKPTVYSWLYNMSTKYGKLTPFGNGVDADIDKICDCVISRGSFDTFVSRNVIELTSIGKMLKFMKLMSVTQSLSLSELGKYFKIDVDELRTHTASYDVWLGSKILRQYSTFFDFHYCLAGNLFSTEPTNLEL